MLVAGVVAHAQPVLAGHAARSGVVAKALAVYCLPTAGQNGHGGQAVQGVINQRRRFPRSPHR